MKWTLWIVVSLYVTVTYGQQMEVGYFRSPVGYQTRLSGSFGEPRSAHFHEGIDFKMQRGVPRDTIYAAAEGYISRIVVVPGGYGNGLFIDHPNGYSTVYGHLYDFSPKIREHINTILYQKNIHTISYESVADSIYVDKGEYIGIMGNTGRSSAPHLHFEIRRTADGAPINPALFGIKPADTQVPVVRGVILYGLSADGEVLDQNYYSVQINQDGILTIPDGAIQSTHRIVGIGIHCYDTMNGARNHNGIYGLKMKVNGEKRYAFEMKEVPPGQAKYIHSHMDYTAKKNRLYYTKIYKAPGNGLTIYRDSTDNGILLLSDILRDQVDVTVYDIEGNTARVKLAIEYAPTTANESAQSDSTYTRVSTDMPIELSADHAEISFRKGAVDAPSYIRLTADELGVAQLEATADIALFEYGRLSFFGMKKEECDKCLITKANDDGKVRHYGALWQGDSILYTRINDLGTYEVLIDTTPPTIQILDLPDASDGRLAFVMTDDLEPAFKKHYLDFDVTVNGEWQLCEYDIKNDKVTTQIDLPSGENEIIIRARDAAKNEVVVKRMVKG